MRFFLLTILFIYNLYADSLCIEHNTTKEIFTKKYSHGIVIKKYYFDNGCGIKKKCIDILQDNKKIDTVNGFYDVKLRSDEVIDNNHNQQIIFTSYTAGHGTDEHAFGIIEPHMKKLFRVKDYDINIKDVDGKKEIILPKSIFFCISNQFCSHATALHIDLILEFDNNKLILDKKSNQQQSNEIQTCISEVKKNKEGLRFTHNSCAENNLKSLGYCLYNGEIEKLKEIVKYFKFDTPMSKNKFKKALLNELKNLEYIEQDDREKEREAIYSI